MRELFMGERCAVGAGDGSEVFAARKSLRFIGLVGSRRTDVPRRQKNSSFYPRIMRGCGRSHEATHTVANDHDPIRINAILRSVPRVEDEIHFRIRIFRGTQEAELPCNSP